MTFPMKNLVLASLAAAALVACGGGDNTNSSPSVKSESATYTSSFAIGDTWKIELNGVTINDVAQTSGDFTGTVVLGAYASFPTGTSLKGKWSYESEKITLTLLNSNNQETIIAFTAEQPKPNKEGETSAVLQIASFTEQGIQKNVANYPVPDEPVSNVAGSNTNKLFKENSKYHFVSLRFDRNEGKFALDASKTGIVTIEETSFKLGADSEFLIGEPTDENKKYFPAYQNNYARGLLYSTDNGNINFDYIDSKLTGMTYLVDLENAKNSSYNGAWKCTSLVDPNLYAQLKITNTTALNAASVEITDFYNGKKVDGPHKENFEFNPESGLIQFKDGSQLNNTFIYPISSNYFIVNDESGEEKNARFLSCVPSASPSETGNNGGGSSESSDGKNNSNGGAATPIAGNFTPVDKTISQKKSEDIDPDAGPNGLAAEAIQLLHFATNRATYKLNTYKYTNKEDNSFGYDLGEIFYINDINGDGGEFFEPSNTSNDQWYAKSFLNGTVIMGCENNTYNWRSTFVAALANSTPITDLSKLNGGIFTSYSCDHGERNGYDQGETIVNGMIQTDVGNIPVNQLFSPSGYNDGNDTYYYKAYQNKDGAIFAVGHEKTGDGINLKIQTNTK